MNSLEFSWSSNPCASAVGGLEEGALAVWDHRNQIRHWFLQYQFMDLDQSIGFGINFGGEWNLHFSMEVAEMKEVCAKLLGDFRDSWPW